MAKPNKVFHLTPLSPGKRSTVMDCAYCRSSEWTPDGYCCKRGLGMNAETCAFFQDSRTPSRHAENTRG